MRQKVFTKPLVFFLLALVVIVILTVLELRHLKTVTADFSTKIIIIGLLTFNAVAISTLLFFIIRNIYKLYYEKRVNIPGHRFKTKLAIIFTVFSLIPSILLFVIASGLATNFIDNVFSPYIGKHMNLSVEMAQETYDLMRRHVLAVAEEVSNGNSKSQFPHMRIYKLKTTDDSSEVIKEAFQGKKGTEVVSTKEGDMIRAAVPTGKQVTVAELLVPHSLTEKVDRLRDFNEEYFKVISYKEPLRLNYILILGFVTLMIVFTGLWFSLKISSSITNPIKELALATEALKAGDFTVKVTNKSSDEIGMLTESFNSMVMELNEHRISLHNAYLESDRRRLYLESILSKIRSGVICLNNEGIIQSVNESAKAILKISDDIRGTHYNDLLQRLQSEDLMRIVKGIQGKRNRSIQRQINLNIDGTNMVLNVFIADIIDYNTNNVFGIVVVFDDITDLIRAQKAIAWHEVAQRIAHEIKNPLTPIKLSAERLLKKIQNRDSDFEAVFHKSMKTIINEVDALKKIVDEFSRFARMPELVMSDCNIVDIVDEVIALYKGYKDVNINVNADSIPDIKMDREQIKRAIINIIDNAIKAMNQSGVIDINIRAEDGKIYLDITDRGSGIKDEDKDKLFLPYFSRAKGGTGLGLAITHKIVTDHNGKITVKNNSTKGSTFTIELPLESK